ncbi:MAG: ergothioneine biosynthesis protein EgtB [Alteromonadaceae bacterium]|nr:ergothioneine biosynthesis protein EgtB [Alteromonadaceae bacterium]
MFTQANQTSKNREELISWYKSVRNYTTEICRRLETEDHVIQPTAEVSPPKWHLGHTTWFFEELVLVRFITGFVRFNANFNVLFNSYYKSAGKHWLQGERGHLSRPRVSEVLAYRSYVDEKLVELLNNDNVHSELYSLLEIGLHHEQQHQELLFMDIKVILGANPLQPAYLETLISKAPAVVEKWKHFDVGVYEVGHSEIDFAYDNEIPKHCTYIHPFAMCENTVTNGEYLKFINDQGYSTPKLWLSLGWDWLNDNNIQQPLYWQQEDDSWYEFTLHGRQLLDLNVPVSHISYFEADAFASWKGCRLPTEQELEIYLRDFTHDDFSKNNEASVLHPNFAGANTGQVWCWTRSHYSPYPGFVPYEGTLEEYNGKFMCNQFVLKGGCIATPEGHYRHTYRNFYQPQQRWMFSGIRLTKDI